MNIPEKCPSKSDKIFLLLNLVRLVLSLVILWLLHWIVMLGYLIFWIIFNFIFVDNYLCKVCIYTVGGKFNSIEEYNKEFQAVFQKRMKNVFRFLLFDWFFAAVISIIILFYNYFINFLNMFAANPSLLLLLVPSMILLLITTQAVIRRTPNNFCKICIYRDHCPMLKMREINKRK